MNLAQEYANQYHQGQFRKGGQLPYIVHPEAVTKILRKYGVNDERTIDIAWLHDTLEDTNLTYAKIKKVFGLEVAKGVYILTRNVDRDRYNQRIAKSSQDIQMVKLADTLHNVSTLQCLSAEGRQKKIRDCQQLYLPLAQQICPGLAQELRSYLPENIMENS